MPIIQYQNGPATYQAPTIQGPYPEDVFLPLIGDPVREASTNHRVPVELAAHAALGVVSLVCQPFINIQCPSFPPASVSLFLMAISDSTGGKSTVQERFLRGVVAFERRQDEEIEVAMSNYDADMEIWLDDKHRLAKEYRNPTRRAADAEGIRAQRRQHEKDRPVKPKKWDLHFADTSPEGLRDALVANPAVAILSPDGGLALNGRAFREPAVLSSYWSGENLPVGRAGGNRRPVEPRVTISVTPQIGPFESYMEDRGSEAFATGLMGRILVACPETIETPGQPTQIEDLPEPGLEKFIQRATQILNQPLPAPGERRVLKLSDGAKLYWKWFTEWVHDNLVCGNLYSQNMKSFFKRLGQQASRLAALFHYFADKRGDDIHEGAMKDAIALCEWYLFEYIRVFERYAPSQQRQDQDAAEKLLHWLQGATMESWRYPKLTSGRYTERDLRNYSKIRGNPMALGNAINMLHSAGQIAVLDGPKGGRIICYPALLASIQPPVNYSPSGHVMKPHLRVPLTGAVIVREHQVFSNKPAPFHKFDENSEI